MGITSTITLCISRLVKLRRRSTNGANGWRAMDEHVAIAPDASRKLINRYQLAEQTLEQKYHCTIQTTVAHAAITDRSSILVSCRKSTHIHRYITLAIIDRPAACLQMRSSTANSCFRSNYAMLCYAMRCYTTPSLFTHEAANTCDGHRKQAMTITDRSHLHKYIVMAIIDRLAAHGHMRSVTAISFSIPDHNQQSTESLNGSIKSIT